MFFVKVNLLVDEYISGQETAVDVEHLDLSKAFDEADLNWFLDTMEQFWMDSLSGWFQ